MLTPKLLGILAPKLARFMNELTRETDPRLSKYSYELSATLNFLFALPAM
jgi:hypothetical protein